MDNNKTLSDIVQLLLPYVPEKKGQIFFKVFSLIEESKSGKLAKEQSGEKCVPVFSRGVVYDSEHGNHLILYEHSHRMSNGYEYRTHLGRELNDLSNEEIQGLYASIKENTKQKEKMIPAVIVEDYDEDIGIEDHSFYAVSFDKSYDQEQGDMSECYDCEDVDIANNKYIFMDYDDAIGFSYDNIRVLESRNNFRREVNDAGEISFHVTFETDDTRLKDIAARYGGTADYHQTGNPIVTAVFPGLYSARQYRDAVREALSKYKDVTLHDIWKAKLDAAGIGVGSQFRIERLCSFNDMKVKSINFDEGKMTFFHPTTHPDYQGEFDWPIDRVLDNIKLYQGSRWIQTDENRKEIVVPEAKAALMERANDKSRRPAFTDAQVYALNRLTTLYSEKASKEDIFTGLVDNMKEEFRKAHIPEPWVMDMRDELSALAAGNRREQQSRGIGV